MRKILTTNLNELVSEYPFAHSQLLRYHSHTWKISLLRLFSIRRLPEESPVPCIEFNNISQQGVGWPDRLNTIEERVRSQTGVKLVRHGWKDKEGESKHDYLSTRATGRFCRGIARHDRTG